MIKVDISKAIPSTAFNYLAAFIPGLFFEISVLMGNPVLIRTLAGQSYAGYALGYYTSLAIAVILAFVIGNGFMLFLTALHRPLVYAYILKTVLRKQIIKLLILPSLKRLWQKPGWQRSPWLNGLLRYAQMEVLQFPPQLMEVQRCWHLVASNLLERRYGIKSPQMRQIDSGIWYSVLPKLTAQETRGSILMIAFHATGWGGIAAIHFAPALNNPYYIGFSLLLIFCGITHDWFIAKWLNDPVMAGLMRVRAGLRELRDTTTGTLRAPSRQDMSDDILSAEADDE